MMCIPILIFGVVVAIPSPNWDPLAILYYLQFYIYENVESTKNDEFGLEIGPNT